MSSTTDEPKRTSTQILTPEQLERKLEPDSHYSIAYTLESRKSMLDAYRALYTEWQAMIKHAANLFTKTVTQGADNHALRQENERLRRGLYADYKQGKRLLDEAIHDGTRTADALNERIYNMLAAEKQRIGELEWKIKGYEHDRIALVYEIDRLRKELRTLTTKE